MSFDWFFHPVIAQGFGLIAFGFGVFAFLNKEDARFKKLLTVQGLTLGLHFFLLGYPVAGSIALFTAVRNVLSLFGKMKPAAPFFLIAYLVIGALTYETLLDVLPVLAAIIGTVSLFYLKGVPMRILTLTATLCWIVHNAIAGSVGPFFMEVFIFSANVKTILALKEDKRKDEKQASFKDYIQ